MFSQHTGKIFIRTLFIQLWWLVSNSVSPLDWDIDFFYVYPVLSIILKPESVLSKCWKDKYIDTLKETDKCKTWSLPWKRSHPAGRRGDKFWRQITLNKSDRQILLLCYGIQWTGEMYFNQEIFSLFKSELDETLGVFSFIVMMGLSLAPNLPCCLQEAFLFCLWILWFDYQ